MKKLVYYENVNQLLFETNSSLLNLIMSSILSSLLVSLSLLLVAPHLIAEPVNQTVTESENVTFFCNATGNPAPKIKWMKDGKTVAEGETLSFETNRNQSGKYWCLADNGLNSTVDTSATLNVLCMLVELDL